MTDGPISIHSNLDDLDVISDLVTDGVLEVIQTSPDSTFRWKILQPDDVPQHIKQKYTHDGEIRW